MNINLGSVIDSFTGTRMKKLSVVVLALLLVSCAAKVNLRVPAHHLDITSSIYQVDETACFTGAVSGLKAADYEIKNASLTKKVIVTEVKRIGMTIEPGGFFDSTGLASWEEVSAEQFFLSFSVVGGYCELKADKVRVWLSGEEVSRVPIKHLQELWATIDSHVYQAVRAY